MVAGLKLHRASKIWPQLMWRVGSPKPVQRISFSGESMVLTRIRKTKSTNFIVTVDKGVITVTSETTGRLVRDADVLRPKRPISPRCDSENRFHCSTVRIYRAGDSNHQRPKTAGASRMVKWSMKHQNQTSAATANSATSGQIEYSETAEYKSNSTWINNATAESTSEAFMKLKW